MANVVVNLTFKDAYLTTILDAISKNAGQELTIRGERAAFSWSYAPKGSGESDKVFGKRFLCAFLLGFVRMSELSDDQERYASQVNSLAQPSQSVPDDIVE